MPAVVQHLIPRHCPQAKLGDTGAVSQHQAGKVPCGLLTHCHRDGCRQCGCPRGGAQFGAHQCPSILWNQPHCPGEAVAPFESNSSTNYGWRGKQNSLISCQESVGVFAVFSVLLMIKKLQSMRFYPCFLTSSLLYANEQGGYLGRQGGKTAKVPL